jgi:hypothetical protein
MFRLTSITQCKPEIPCRAMLFADADDVRKMLDQTVAQQQTFVQHADTTFTDFVVPAGSKAVVETLGAMSLKNCPLMNMAAKVNGSALFFAEQTGSLTLQHMSVCEACDGVTYMKTSGASMYSDGSPGASLLLFTPQVLRIYSSTSWKAKSRARI